MFNIAFHEPEIPGNSGSTIRLSAVSGVNFHIIKPVGFDLKGKQVKRAGLDYHDMASLHIYSNIEDLFESFPNSNIYAFSGKGETNYSYIKYRRDDILLFGKESNGLPQYILKHQRITTTARIPMTKNARSLNLANSAAIVVYEALRQNNFCDLI